MNAGELAALIAACTGMGGAGGAIVVKALNRGVDNADAEQRLANARKSDVDTLREIIAEVREADQQKARDLAETRVELGQTRGEMSSLRARVEKLEERERHMLTRAAVHEAWDVLAYNHLSQQQTETPFPPPPPLTGGPLDD